MWHVVVQISCSQDDEYVEVTALHQVEYVFLVYHAFLYSWLQVVIDQLGCNTWDRLLASRVDVAEDYFVQETQAVGKVFVEVAGSSIQVRLEDGCYLAILV